MLQLESRVARSAAMLVSEEPTRMPVRPALGPGLALAGLNR